MSRPKKHMDSEKKSPPATAMPEQLLMSSHSLCVCVRGSGCYGYAFLWISLQADK